MKQKCLNYPVWPSVLLTCEAGTSAVLERDDGVDPPLLEVNSTPSGTEGHGSLPPPGGGDPPVVGGGGDARPEPAGRADAPGGVAADGRRRGAHGGRAALGRRASPDEGARDGGRPLPARRPLLQGQGPHTRQSRLQAAAGHAQRRRPARSQLVAGERRVAGEERHVPAALLRLLHVGQLGALRLLSPPAVPALGLLLLAACQRPASQGGRRGRLRRQVPAHARARLPFCKNSPVTTLGSLSSLMKHLTLVTDDPDGEYPDQDAVWDKFERAFIAGAGLVSHAPVLRDYLLRGLHELHRDNVMYLELRSGLSRTYELDGTIHDKIWTLRTFQDVIGKFVAEHPDFLGARLIIAVHRALSASEVKAAVKEATELRRDFPDVVAGFDLVPIRVLRGTTDTARRLHNGYRISCIAGGQGGRRQAALVLPGRSVAPGPDGRHAALLLSRGRNRRGGDGDGSERSGRPAVQQQPHRARLRPGAPPARQGDVPGEAGGGGGVPHLKPGTEVGLRPAQPPGGGADGGGPPAGDQLGRPVHVRHGGPVLRLLPGLRGHRRPEGQRGHAEGAGAQLHQVQLSAADAQGLGAGRVAEEMGRLRFGSRLRARRKPFHNARWNLLSRVGPER
ncbi:uncharacterized protein ada2b isoform X2 [Phyllopteryx taeniolatus]|uniref:uncharacterized protein ada2b isoform X2 n=1 Tax=Phyllopteryx taeniolatus TaxID=161469 RepID=UPI002AD57642|nr:uncharacterized protein ada2b isoform X2 [Phyllopteryx taeniolatus]